MGEGHNGLTVQPAGAHRTSSRPTEFSTGSGFGSFTGSRSYLFQFKDLPRKFYTVSFQYTSVTLHYILLNVTALTKAGPLPDQPSYFLEMPVRTSAKKI